MNAHQVAFNYGVAPYPLMASHVFPRVKHIILPLTLICENCNEHLPFGSEVLAEEQIFPIAPSTSPSSLLSSFSASMPPPPRPNTTIPQTVSYRYTLRCLKITCRQSISFNTNPSRDLPRVIHVANAWTPIRSQAVETGLYLQAPGVALAQATEDLLIGIQMFRRVGSGALNSAANGLYPHPHQQPQPIAWRSAHVPDLVHRGPPGPAVFSHNPYTGAPGHFMAGQQAEEVIYDAEREAIDALYYDLSDDEDDPFAEVMPNGERDKKEEDQDEKPPYVASSVKRARDDDYDDVKSDERAVKRRKIGA